MDCLCIGSSFMADLSSCRPSCYGRAQQITNDRQQDSHDGCLAKTNLEQTEQAAIVRTERCYRDHGKKRVYVADIACRQSSPWTDSRLSPPAQAASVPAIPEPSQ